MERLGLVSFQANDISDVFWVAEVVEDGFEQSNEAVLEIEEPDFETDFAWITGNVPEFKSINIEGDNVQLRAWLRGERFYGSYALRIYVEYELAEELIEVVQEKDVDEDDKSDLEPQEIHL
jgi:hypothetical protein